MEYVEVKGKSVEIAVQAALTELGIDDPTRAEVEVLQEPQKGFLGMGGQPAIVRVKPKPRPKRRRRRGRGGGEAKSGEDRGSGKGGRSRSGQRDRQDGKQDGKKESARRAKGPRAAQAETTEKEQRPDVDIESFVPIVRDFLSGLVASFGLEGEVSVRVDGDTIIAEVHGEQTEALVGPRGSVMEAVHDLTKTVMQRQTQSSARLRLDIAGYAERRRQALTIYANQLIDQVLTEGGELMLDPMSASDRKVIHDAVAARPGVRSYSEGTAPQRFVVIARSEDEEGEESSEPAFDESEE